MANNKIGYQGATAIANAIAVNATVTILGLDGNKIGDAGAAAIANAIAVNATLKLQLLDVDSAVRSNPQLVAACRAKGVKLQ